MRCRAPGVGQGAFPRRRSRLRGGALRRRAREAYGRARECAENDAASGAHDGSVPNGDVAILERRIAACARAARGAAMCDEEESSLAAAAEARRLEAERKMEASSDENVARLNAEAEDRERDPNARRLIREIEALFAEARKTTEETRDAEETEETPAASGKRKTGDAKKNAALPRARRAPPPRRASVGRARELRGGVPGSGSVPPREPHARRHRVRQAVPGARARLRARRRLPGDVPRDHAGGGRPLARRRRAPRASPRRHRIGLYRIARAERVRG